MTASNGPNESLMDPQATAQPSPHRKLLIVDDEQKICQVLAQYFSMKGYEVRTVCRGEEAVALLSAFQPNVVLLDLLMPGISGIDTLKKLKQLVPSLRIIMLSAADHHDVAEGALKLGADCYVCKPPNLRELERLVNGFWPSEKRRS